MPVRSAVCGPVPVTASVVLPVMPVVVTVPVPVLFSVTVLPGLVTVVVFL
jgi:hypothetical protein